VIAAGALEALSRGSHLTLGAYRPAHVAQSVRRALEREQISDPEALARLLDLDEEARARFRRSVAVSVTGMFRDPAQFELLEHELLPPLLEGSRRFTVWSAGCADGSELLSLAALLERLGALPRAFLLGSDVLEENVNAARRAAADADRASIRFERRDLVSDGPPPGRWRLILCRNLAIYLAPDAKRALHATLAQTLAVGGVLMLGRSETLSAPATLGLECIAPHAYRRTP
jgi:chemotaxis protein methyltransferase CheR